ncbi:hypothetical protein ACHWQZ_G008760 [Mnemiopsis leidyi]
MTLLWPVLPAVVMATLTTALHIDDAVSPSQNPEFLDDKGDKLEHSWSPAKLRQLEKLFTPMKNGIGELYEYLSDEKQHNRCLQKLEQFQRLLTAVNNPAFTLEFLLSDSEIDHTHSRMMMNKLTKMEERIEKLIETWRKEFGVFDTSMRQFLATTKELKKILED